MPEGAYAAAVKETFEVKPLRTVLMIDDEFPTFADLATTDVDKKVYGQTDRALVLYKGFKARHMVCDVENHVDDVEADRLRKSDLIVLDYNLGPSDGDNTKSVGILRRLAASKHFNTVVVYTADPEQDKVWLEIAASLAGGWNANPQNLDDVAAEHWERLASAGHLPEPPIDASLAYAARLELRDLPSEVRRDFQRELADLGVPALASGPIIRALLDRAMVPYAGAHATAERRRVRGGCSKDGPRWVQSQNCFIAILQKTDEYGVDATDPAGIMACLGRALLAWRPNLFQILISEIQNILELEALATEDEHLRDPETQTALWYYLLNALGEIDLASPEQAHAPLMAIVDRIVDGIRRKLASDPELLKLASSALTDEIAQLKWHERGWPSPGSQALFDGAKELARPERSVDKPNVMFRLNSFLSTERFNRNHITTGTIFSTDDGTRFWIAASPACDLAARTPSAMQRWSHALHPTTAVITVELEAYANTDAALTNAAQGKFVFLETPTGKQTFRILGENGQPPYEILFAENEGRVRSDGGRTVFSASRLVPEGDPPTRTLKAETFVVVSQLRGLNATRVLQLTGQHLSRIGLDFLDMPAN
jgi:hypothetical protein